MALTGVCSFVSCTGTIQARFAGTAYPPIVDADALVQQSYVPHDHASIGTVEASCELVADEQADACSELELLRAMRSAAAGAGATALVAPKCQRLAHSTSRQNLRCSATAARPGVAPGGSSDSRVAEERVWTVEVGGTAVRVTVRPGPGITPAPHPNVEHVWARESTHIAVGFLSSKCQDPCDRTDAEAGLSRGAAWLGADYSSVRCVEAQARRWACTAEALRYPAGPAPLGGSATTPPQSRTFR